MKNLIHLGLSVAMVLALAPNAAAENECETDADCPSGLICVEGEPQADAPVIETEAAPIDMDGSTDSEDEEGEADKAAPEPTDPPEEEIYKYCDLKPCEADADCGDGTVCVVLQVEECASIAVE
ncbi:MAG: hypothetical protein VYE15_02150, partial [Myxococcota bacterium]|nr:hypothetical protein [Myxococcota bacterium]